MINLVRRRPSGISRPALEPDLVMGARHPHAACGRTDRPGDLLVGDKHRDDNVDVVVFPRQVTEGPTIHVYRESVSDRADGSAGGVHEHAGGVDVDMTVGIS